MSVRVRLAIATGLIVMIMLGVFELWFYSDLIASEGADHFRILLTTPDAENSDAIAERVGALSEVLNQAHPSDGAALEISTSVEVPPDQPTEKGPCDPCEEHELITRDTDRDNPLSAFVTPLSERDRDAS